jgi:small subunit ribosomal protein S16
VSVKIRLKKMGRRHRPFFRLCAMDNRAPRDGRVIEELGIYDPMVRETDARAILKGERIDYWISVGAQPTPKAAVLIRKYGTDGSHLDQQQQALNRLAGRKANAISAATTEAQKAAARQPKEEPKPDEAEAAAPATEEGATEAVAAKAPAAAEAPATEAPATEAPATEAPATEAPAADAPAEESAEEPAEE